MTITKMRVVGFVMRVFVVQLRNKSVEIKGNIFLLKQVSLHSTAEDCHNVKSLVSMELTAQ